MRAGEHEQLVEREPGLDEAHAGGDDRDVAGRVARLALVVARHEQPFVRDGFEQRERDAAALRQLVEREELLGVLRVGGEHGLRERLVGGVELAAHAAGR